MQTITLMNKGKALPSVDVVIPTLNCRELLRQCLIRLKQQNYPGSVHIVVMDGGSTDGTPTLARDFGCEVVVREGLYSNGLTGARNLSLDYCKGDLYWQIDADNIIVDENVLYLLVEPFLQVDDLQLSIPMIATDETQADIDRYLAFDERRRLEEMSLNGQRTGHWIILEDSSYGITNATLIRTSMLRKVGGYDSDVRVLRRARRQGLSRGVIVENAMYFHLQAQSWKVWVRKQLRRVRRFGALTGTDLNQYFAPASHDHIYRGGAVREILRTARISWELRRRRLAFWWWGPLLLLGWGVVFLLSPKAFIRTFLNFL